MLDAAYEGAQRLAFSSTRWVRVTALTAVCAAGAALIALFIGIAGPLIALAAAVALVGGALIILDTHWGFVALAGVVFILPFASLPFSIGFKPTFLDLALAALVFVWIVKLAIGQEREFIASPLGVPISLFMLMALFSFVFGMAHSSANSFFIRRFAEILLGIGLFFIAVNSVRSEREIVWVVRWLMLAAWGAAAIAVAFYVMPQAWTVAVLNRLVRFDYPGGYGALRWIEDDTSGTMRAIGTAVDPNVLGGMMILAGALLAPQLFTPARLFPRRLAVVMFLTAAAALYLTYSRSALLGLAAAIGFIAVLKYRKLLLVGVAGGLLLLLLPQTQAYVARLVAGFAGQDLATQMRFGEYKDALILIGRYPLFGVGFTGVPDIDLYLGVSMLYLILAENMGVIGLLFFGWTMIGFFVLLWRTWRQGFSDRLEPIALGLAGAVLGALVSGIFDHYWFNITYPHMTVLLWLFLGLGVAAVEIQRGAHEVDEGAKIGDHP